MRSLLPAPWIAFALLDALACACESGAPSGKVDSLSVEDVSDIEAPSDTRDVPFVIPNMRDLTRFVDPRIGTANSGNVTIGAAVPHGWVRAGPHCVGQDGSVVSYRDDSTSIRGFSHTNLSGPGGSAYGYSQVLLMPSIGPLVTDTEDKAAPIQSGQVVEPGYYAVTFGLDGLRAEMTATGHAALHRYTYPQATESHVTLDLGTSLGQSLGGELRIEGQTVRGHGVYQVHPPIALLLGEDEPTGIEKVYVVARFSRSVSAAGAYLQGEAPEPGVLEIKGSGSSAFLSFGPTVPGEVLEVAVGLSLIDEATAEANLDAEIGSSSLEEVRAAADTAWNERLNRIQVDGDLNHKQMFYTALYHVMLQPVDYTEAGGRAFSAFDGKGAVFDTGGRRYYSDDWCAWDTFRTAHPLRTLLEPEIVGDIVQSYVHGFEEGGWLEKCPFAGSGYSRVMIANATFPIITDALMKGLDDFDVETAYAAMRKSATEDNANPLEDGGCGYLNLGTPPFYREHGYVNDECDKTQAASMTLEYAYEDWCVARVADALGKSEDAVFFDARASNWKNQWNPATGFMQSKRADGSWREPFDPADGSSTSGFCESTAWTYTFHVQHDLFGLMYLMDPTGTGKGMNDKLDAFFDGGHFDVSNEPGFHIPWIYALMRAPAKTAERVRATLDAKFGTGPGGLPGNDDSGATSAWAAFAMMGIYPVTPGSGHYIMNTPVFERTTFHLHPAHMSGGTFVILAEGAPAARYILGASRVTGQPHESPILGHSVIAEGGTLTLTLGDSPGSWGADLDW